MEAGEEIVEGEMEDLVEGGDGREEEEESQRRMEQRSGKAREVARGGLGVGGGDLEGAGEEEEEGLVVQMTGSLGAAGGSRSEGLVST